MIIGPENQFSVLLRVAVLHRFHCIANSGDRDEMPNLSASNQGVSCLLLPIYVTLGINGSGHYSIMNFNKCSVHQ